MRVLIACEQSGTVRDAFRKRGHEAYSCDLLPDANGQSRYHIQADLFTVIDDGWDFIGCHYPCTFLCGSGIHWNSRRPERAAQTAQAIADVRRIWATKCPKMYLENPVGVLSRPENLGKPAQIVQPYHFGHDASKATCLWLKGLPLLTHGAYVQPRMVGNRPRWGNQTDSGQNKLTPSPDRWKLRSKTYDGIATAMAEQWG